RMNRWRESLREGWLSFSPEEREHFRHMHESGPRHRPGPGPDRDMAGVVPELNEARRALKAALAAARGLSPDDQRRVAAIVGRAAEEIRGVGRAPGDDIDL